MKNTETVQAKHAPAVSEHMKRRADSIACTYGAELFTLGWIAGLLSAFLGGAVPAAAAALLLTAVLLLLRKKHMLAVYLRVCAGILLGLAVWTGYDLAVRQPLFALDGTVQICTGTVTDAEQLRDGRTRYTLRTELAGHRISTDWYASAEIPRLQTGDTVKLNAELTRIQPDYRYHTAAYQAELDAVRCGSPLLLSGEPFPADTLLLGAEPVGVSDGSVSVRCGDAEITAAGDELRITWNGMTVPVSKEAELPGNAAAVRYGKDGCTVQLSTDPPLVYTENNLCLRLTERGGGSIERLMKTP